MVLSSYAVTSYEVFPPDSKPYGLSYEEWSAKWMKWLASIPGEVNPSNDETGQFCATGQNATGPVWFLAGTSDKNGAERDCTIPEGKSILISPIDAIFTFKEAGIHTEAELRDAAKRDQDNVKIVELKVNDVEVITDYDKFRFQSPIFDIKLPQNNIAGYPPGPTQAVTDGYYIMLKPLPAGTYKIESMGHMFGPSGANPGASFISDVTYNITIK
ncbi:hypothetical protein [Candidatus Nitrosocosmicus sp. FF01]|uniref:hypothetical protein n=1 Tax=Candidatus Nitrosocosmicus sp. FF01 TaxID=3397670 RepID=UPI0039EA465A